MLSDPARIQAPLRDRALLVFIAAASVAAAFLSALLIGHVLDNMAAVAVFVALILAAASVAFAVTRARLAARADADTTDWSSARILLDGLGQAAAISDRDGGLILANQQWADLAGGYQTPIEFSANNERLQQTLIKACEDAERQGEGSVADFQWPGANVRRSLSVRRLDDHIDGCRLWLAGPPLADRQRHDVGRLLKDYVGHWFSRAGISAVLTDKDGRVFACNENFINAVGAERAQGSNVTLTSLLDLDEAGTFSLIRSDGRTEAVTLIEFDLNETGVASDSYLFLLVDQGRNWPQRTVSDSESVGSIPALLGTLPLGLALTDQDGRFRFINQAFSRAAGLAQDEEVLYPSDLVHDDEKAMVSDAIRKVAGARPALRDLRVRLKSAPDKTVVITLACVTGLGLPAVILYLADNSEQEKLERQVAQATKMQAVGQLAGGVAHDFNNILTAIIGYCDLMLLRHGPGDSDFDDITQIKQNANRAANLVRQLLAFSRQQTLRPQVLQISDVVGELSHLLKRLLGERITFTVKHGRNLGPVRADPGQLEQVIVNLAVNARDAMNGVGQLTISTHAVTAADIRRSGSDIIIPADYTMLRISDTGEGIPADVVSKIFEPFFTTKEVGKGTGLGLSTVYGIVKQTGGYIFAESLPGEGATFTIYLPVYQGQQVDGEATRLPTQRAQANELWGVGTILLVEDEATVRAVAERALVRKGYRVVTAANGVEALEQLDNEDQIDLLISDVVMPEMDGPTLVNHAREKRPDLPIVFMSGYAEEQLRKTISVPNFAFLPKPFSVSQLGEAVREALMSMAKRS